MRIGESGRAENRACLLSLSLLPPGEIVQAANIRSDITDDGQHTEGLKKLIAYINKQNQRA